MSRFSVEILLLLAKTQELSGKRGGSFESKPILGHPPSNGRGKVIIYGRDTAVNMTFILSCGIAHNHAVIML